MGNIKPLTVCAASGVLLAVSCILSVSCDNSNHAPPNTHIYSQLQGTASDGPTVLPDCELVVVRDIAGFFSDCGCAGDLGGAFRLPSVVHPSADVTYLFIGGSALPPFLYGAAEKHDQENSGVVAAHFVNYMRDAFLALAHSGDVLWLPSSGEKELLSRLAPAMSDVASYMLASSEFTWHGLTLSITDTSIEVRNEDGTFTRVCRLPPEGDRGREVAVVGLWRSKQEGAVVVDPSLGALAAHTGVGGNIVAEMDRRLTKHLHDVRVVSAWRRKLHSGIARDVHVSDALVAAEVRLQHSLPITAELGEHSSTQAHEHWRACEACHPQAFAAWVQSKHSTALKPLLAKGMGKDPRCLPCHTTAFSIEKGQVSIAPEHSAITCVSCHTSSSKPTMAVCESYHTQLADPLKNYQKMLRSICPGDVANNERCTLPPTQRR